MSLKKTPWIAALGALLFLASCGGDGSGDGSEPTPEPEESCEGLAEEPCRQEDGCAPVFAPGAGFVACAEGDESVQQCLEDSDCEEGEVCEPRVATVEGVCEPRLIRCESDDECPEGQICALSLKNARVQEGAVLEAGSFCSEPPEMTCETSADCAEEEFCEFDGTFMTCVEK